mmetsp:Transcript_40066/g.111350  ORF Transcript_40066/g.111350 Transcript_40066/m.111350 type:complete len:836 (-) Transcript_40066:165-2672(-)
MMRTMPKSIDPSSCRSAIVVPVLLLLGCGRTYSQPLEGRYASRVGEPTIDTVPSAMSVPARSVLNSPVRRKPIGCPTGSYRSSPIIWVCHGAEGKRFSYMKPNAAETMLEIPAGIQDLWLNVTTPVDTAVKLTDADSGTLLIQHGQQLPSGLSSRLSITYISRSPSAPGTEALHIPAVAGRLRLMLSNPTNSWQTASMNFRFRHVPRCPQLPEGCLPYDKPAAFGEVKAWSAWAQGEFPSVAVAWRELARGLGEAGRRLRVAEPDPERVPWYRWGAVWSRWGGAASSTSWQYAFAFLDADGDAYVERDEFSAGYALAKDFTAGHKRAPASSGAASAPSGGMFMPTWVIWAIPLLVAGCLIASLLTREVAQKSFRQVPAGDSADVRTQPLHGGKQPERANVQATPVTQTTLPKVEAMTRKMPQECFNPRNSRACDSGFGGLGLLECGWRKDGKGRDLGVAGKPQCSKCGWQCRCPGCTRDSRVLPPVLAWRGPDEGLDEDEIVALVRGMRADPQNATLQESSCVRLEELALAPQSKMRIASLGGIDAIMEAMKHHPSVAGVQETASAALGNLALRSEENQKAMLHKGGIEAVLTAMAQHLPSESVQEKACWALQQLAMVAQSRAEITNHGGIERVAQAMRAHAMSEPVQEHGCMALGNLAFEVETRKCIAYVGGIDAVICAMRAFPGAAALQEDACFALHNLACSDEAMRPIAEAGGLEAVVRAMSEHPMTLGVQENAISALHNVNCGPLQYVHKVVGLGGIELIVRAMQQHSVPSLQAKACHVLGQLGDRDDHVRRHIERVGGRRAIELAKSTFQSSKEVQQESREALRILEDLI